MDGLKTGLLNVAIWLLEKMHQPRSQVKKSSGVRRVHQNTKSKRGSTFRVLPLLLLNVISLKRSCSTLPALPA